MDRRWERNGKDEAEPWESVSPSEDEEGESSAGEFEGTDMVMVQQAVADEGFYVLEFPRRELGAVLEGINKFPWVVYPVHLISLMSYACKALGMGIEAHSDIRRLQALYREAVPGTLEKCLDDKAIWRWSADVQINIFQAIRGLIDLVVLKLSQLRISRAGDFAVMDDLLPLLQTLAIAFDKLCQFHLKHKETAVPTAMVASSEKSNYAKPLLGTPVRQKNGEWHCARRKIQVKEVEDCDCERCRPPNVYCLLAHLMNYFGYSPYGDGYKQLAEVVSAPQKLPPAIIEALLLLLERTVDFISDEGVQIFVEPCMVVLGHVADCLEKDVDALSDKTRRDSFGTLSMILRHLRAIIARGSSAENAENVVSIVQRRMVERMLGFQSFNKQLSAVREINKLLENARSVASRDNGKSVCTTIEWLERNNILHHTLRSHLHHKQYVDQVQNIMRLLLLEHRLSEEHLDAIWAATEKPDQFEAVKANVFDLIADLAWSFSDKQLDSLFGRLKHVQGRSTGDIIKILTFLKKLARSDNKGIMAERLLELLWNMMYMGEAPGEVLESGAFTEILGHYISVDRANQDVYILRCLAKVKAGESVIPSLRLLRDIIWLDNEKPFYKGQVSRQMRLQQLINDHNLIDLVVSSLVQYVAMPHMACSTRTPNSKTLDGQLNHDENIKERLSFLQFALQSGAVCLPWESAEKLWNCLVELQTCTADEESGLQWFCEVLDKRALSVDSQENLLTKKITKVWPSSMSQTAWRCFKQLFVHVNLNQKKLKQLRHDYAVGINDLDLVGLPYLWQIALWSRNKIIVEESINMLRDIHTSLVENLQQDLIAIREDFINKCMEHLICALDTGESWKSIEDVKEQYRVGGKKSEDMAKEDNNLKTYTGVNVIANTGDTCKEEMASATLKAGSMEDATKCVSKMDQVERCLRLLRNFVIKCEDSFPRMVPAHGASFQGRPYIVGVSTASSKQSTRFEIMVYSNEYLGSLRAKIAKLLECKASRVRLIHLDRELAQDSLVLWQCGVTGEHLICASVNAVDRNPKTIDEQQLPGILMSKNTQIYDILFKLANASDMGVREGANSLLALLPTHPKLLADFQSLHRRSKAEAQKLLETHFNPKSHLLYTLQIVDGIVNPVNRSVDEHTHQFRKCFLNYGVPYVLAVFEHGNLHQGVDDQTRRGCYSSALRLLKFLLLESKIETRAAEIGHVFGYLRADANVAIKDKAFDSKDEVMTQEYESIVVCTDSEKSEMEIIDMTKVIGVLKQLTWASALGQLSKMEANPFVYLPLESTSQQASNKLIGTCKEDGLELDDQYLSIEALELLIALLLRYKDLISAFFTSPSTKAFIVGLLLYPSDEFLRYRAAMLFLKLGAVKCQSGGKQGHVRQYILEALIEAKDEASRHPKSCLHFWELLGQLLFNIEDPEEYSLAQKQLDDELHWLETAPAAVDEEDKLMEGHLLLTRVLVEILDCRIIGSSKVPQGRRLVYKLISTFLFPESTFLWHDEETNGNSIPSGVQFGIIGTSPESDRVFQSKCATRASRDKAFQLLISLVTHCIESLHELVELLVKIHFTDDLVDWEQPSSYGQKTAGGYVGLKNGGATCYMNSVFQQLFMQPEVRKTVLSCVECADVEKKNSVFFQIQAMFGALLGSSLDHYTPQGFWGAFRDYDGSPVNIREHQDAFEFFNRLYDAIDETLKAYHPETTLSKIFGGIFAQQVICRGCRHKSEREEPFAAISVDVKNKKNLIESLKSFVQGDLLEGENAYYCEKCNKKVDALKRTCIKSLPNTLVIHLKRFDFDYETMQRLKLKDRFEFPIHLDMKSFTVEGLALQENENLEFSDSKNSDNGSIEASSEHTTSSEGNRIVPGVCIPDSFYQYDLVGVVVHTGTAFAGHYYSYIKERPGDGLLNCRRAGTGGYVADAKWWMSFDDKQVQAYDLKNLEKDCFGGKFTVDVYDNFLKTNSPQEYDKPNSAYMLLYERARSEVFLDSPAPSANSCIKDEDGDALMKEIQQVEPTEKNTYIEMPPSIHLCVWKENLKFVHEMHLLDKDYFRFLLKLVEANTDLIDSSYMNQQVERPSGTRTGVMLTDVVKDEFAKLNIFLVTEFLFRVYLHTHQNLRDDLPRWKVLLCRMFEHSPVACQSFIYALVKQPNWIFDYLLKCPIDEIQQVFSTLLVQALQYAVKFCHHPSSSDSSAPTIDDFCVDDLISVFLALLKDGTTPKYYLHKYFKVILEYARFGPEQREHLLQKNIFSHLIGFATKLNLQDVKQDLSCLHSIVSLLLRSCDTTPLNNDAEQRMVLPNPNQLQEHPFPLPRDAEEAIFKHRLYTNILIETCPDQDEVITLLEFCSWQNQSFSLCLLQDIMELVQRAVNNELNNLLILLTRLLLLNDSLQMTRQEIALLGFENFPLGIMDLLVSREQMSSYKRYTLLKFVVKLVARSPDTRLLLLGKQVEWSIVVDWLQDQLDTDISSVTLQGSRVSNGDISRNRLQRTSTSERTLHQARNLFNSSEGDH